MRGCTCGLNDTASTDNVVPARSQTLARRTAPPVFPLVACVPLGLRFPLISLILRSWELLHFLLRFDELDVASLPFISCISFCLLIGRSFSSRSFFSVATFHFFFAIFGSTTVGSVLWSFINIGCLRCCLTGQDGINLCACVAFQDHLDGRNLIASLRIPVVRCYNVAGYSVIAPLPKA